MITLRKILSLLKKNVREVKKLESERERAIYELQQLNMKLAESLINEH